MRFPPKIQLPPELFYELANAFRFDFRWSVLRVSSSIFDHFLSKRQQKIHQNVDLFFQQHISGHLNVPMHEAVLAARVLAKFQTGHYKEMYAILESSRRFSDQIQPMLQKMWMEAHYIEDEKIQGSQLGPVDKYRVRKKHPMPPAIWKEENAKKVLPDRSLPKPGGEEPVGTRDESYADAE
ncbi:hypothetical protein niasHT_029569 [Heterodera trifolii]|uniref:Homeobox protein SIX1 N-terminal SD domain-containing protein n=1 Tax=Heterodera trifolii TaxID=157864 RepID=A0ABD2JB28_9BILA